MNREQSERIICAAICQSNGLKAKDMSTIQKRSNNTYTITVSLGYGADGKQIRRTKTIEADSKLTPKQIEKYVQQEAALFEAE